MQEIISTFIGWQKKKFNSIYVILEGVCFIDWEKEFKIIFFVFMVIVYSKWSCKTENLRSEYIEKSRPQAICLLVDIFACFQFEPR